MLRAHAASHAEGRREEKHAEAVNEFGVDHENSGIAVAVIVARGDDGDENGEDGQREDARRSGDAAEMRMGCRQGGREQAGGETVKGEVHDPPVLGCREVADGVGDPVEIRQ
jgi:hypothetical protein